MPIRFPALVTNGKKAPDDPSRVAPQLADLMAQARRAAALPGWTRAVRARQRGDYRAPLKGRGMEYAESRPYQAGDDIRAMDWRLTARIGRPHTKVFQEERERPVYICIDARANMAFATRGAFKSVQAGRVAALLAWKAVQNGDRVGGIIFTDTVHHELEPARGTLATVRLLKAVVANPASPTGADKSVNNGESAKTALGRLRRLVKPGSLVFIVTDGRRLGIDAAADFSALARHNDVGLLVVYDDFEANLPNLARPLKLASATTEYTLPPTSPELLQAYHRRFEAQQADLSKTCREHQILYATLATNGDPFNSVQRLLGFR